MKKRQPIADSLSAIFNGVMLAWVGGLVIYYILKQNGVCS